MNLFNQQYFLYEYQIEAIKREAREGLKEDVGKQLLEAIIQCFLEWQIAHGIKPVFGGNLNLLSSFLDLNKAPEKLAKEDIEKFEPWQCAGFGVNNYLDLVFKLWTEAYEPFGELIKEFGLHAIFALLLDLTDKHEVQHSNSIFRAYDYILHYRLWMLEIKNESMFRQMEYKKLKHDQQIREAREVAAYSKKAKSNEYKRLWNAWAFETKNKNPFWTKKQIVNYVWEVSKQYNHKMANGKPYQISTIDKVISLKEISNQ